MKKLLFALLLLTSLSLSPLAKAQTCYTFIPQTSCGTRDDGSIQSSYSIGINPVTGNNVIISAPPVVALTKVISPSERFGKTMDVRGTGTNPQIIIGPGSGGAVRQD